MKPTNRFERGSGVYTCRCCERRTRSTGRGDNEHVQLCAECYDLSGWENAWVDGRKLSEGEKADCLSIYAAIKELGGDNTGFDDLIEAIKKGEA